LANVWARLVDLCSGNQVGAHEQAHILEWHVFRHNPAGYHAGQKMFNPAAPGDDGLSPQAEIAFQAPTFLVHGINGGNGPTSCDWRN
jgi:hypothetical protein